jgi:hypothetical protein
VLTKIVFIFLRPTNGLFNDAVNMQSQKKAVSSVNSELEGMSKEEVWHNLRQT